MTPNLIPITTTIYQEYFDDLGENLVFLLSDALAKHTWSEEVDASARSYFDLPDDSWLVKGDSSVIGRWIESYNADDRVSVSTLLSKSVGWSDEQEVRFFAKQTIVFQTTWSTFRLFWDDFLAAEDDCPIVMPTGIRHEALLFTAMGDIVRVGSTKGNSRHLI